MRIYTIEITDAQQKAMEYVALDVKEWIQHAITNRASLAIDEIVGIEVERKLSIGESIVGTKEDIVLASTLPTALERENVAEADREARRNQRDSNAN